MVNKSLTQKEKGVSVIARRYSGIMRRAAACCLAALTVFFASQFLIADAYGFDNLRSRADRALKEGEFDTAEKLYRELLAKDSADRGARLGLSYTLLKKRNLQDAYDHAARVVAVDPLSPRAHAILGTVILAAGDFRLSVEEFRTALSLKDSEALAIAGLAMVDFYENRPAQSLEGLRRASFIDPNEPDFVFNLAQAAARTERYKEAADSYERFLRIAPKTDADRRDRIRGLIDFLRYLGKQSALYVLGGEGSTKLSVDIPDNRAIMDVKLNGRKEPFRFVLDTGSGISVISEQTAERIGVKPIARGGLARAVGGGGKFEIVYGFLETIDIGDVRVSNVPVYIRRFYGTEHPVDGYIGLAVINKYLATLDYGAKTFELSRNRSVDLEQGVVVDPSVIEFPLRMTSSGFLSGEVTLDGVSRPQNFIIDTGASISVLSQSFANKEDLSAYTRSGRMRVYGAAGVVEDVETLLLPKVVLGTTVRESIRAAVLDLDPVNETAGYVQSGIIGGNFLRHYRVTFDFLRGVIKLKPLAPTVNPGDGVRNSGSAIS
jgi:tetratricopeptide (TPR) repeat protein